MCMELMFISKSTNNIELIKADKEKTFKMSFVCYYAAYKTGQMQHFPN